MPVPADIHGPCIGAGGQGESALALTWVDRGGQGESALAVTWVDRGGQGESALALTWEGVEAVVAVGWASCGLVSGGLAPRFGLDCLQA